MMKNIVKTIACSAVTLLASGMMFVSCTAEPDDSNLYTFTGFTIEEFIAENDNLSSFNYILTRVGYDRIMSSYGAYTCFAPVNDAVTVYLDSLYNDPEKAIENPHNGIADHGTLSSGQHVELEWLPDSLCLDIVKYHITGSSSTTATPISVMDLTDKLNIPMLLGRSVIVHIDDLSVNGPYLNKPNVYILNLNDPTESKTAVNGIIHVISNVIPRDNDLIGSRMAKEEDYSIFFEALEKTGLLDSLLYTKKDKTYDQVDTYERATNELHWYIPQDFESKIMFTIFAETNDVFKANGINSLDDLIKKANEWYGDAKTWYNYLDLPEDMQRVKIGDRVSTGTDYESRNNALNMFVAYHILPFGLSSNNVTTDYAVVPSTLHGNNGDSYDYYETMLPNTLIKAWYVNRDKKTYLNRYIQNNTLTDELESHGSDGMHNVVYEGNEVDLGAVESPLNGYIYPIKDILLYNQQVPNGVLKERMRIDWLSQIPEIMSNGFRGASVEDIAQRSGGAGARIRFPNDFFDYVRVYNGNKNTHLGMNVRGGYSLYQGDSFRHVGVVDFAIKLPPVPEGDYELRLDFTLASHFGMVQYYLGRTNDPNDMIALDIPMDCRMDYDDPRIGFKYMLPSKSDQRSFYSDYDLDKGFALDKELRNRGWMLGPLSTVRETQKRNEEYFVRFTTHQLRRIMVKQHFDQGDYWLRVKSVLSNYPDATSQLDYVEFVPLEVVNNNRYLEDMY